MERLRIVMGGSAWSQWGRGGVAKRGTLKAQGSVPVNAKADCGRAGRYVVVGDNCQSGTAFHRAQLSRDVLGRLLGYRRQRRSQHRHRRGAQVQLLELLIERLRILNTAQLDCREPVDVDIPIRNITGTLRQNDPILGVGAAAGSVDADARAVLGVFKTRRSKHAH